MNFLADENVDRQIADCLRLMGHNVEYVAEKDTRKAEIVFSAIKKHGAELKHSFSVITPGAVRIRHEIE